MKKNNYISGQKINKYNISYVSDAESKISTNGRIRRVCFFKCHCEKIFKSILSDVVGNKRTSCGCRKGSRPNIYKEGDLINGFKFIKSCGTINYAQRAIFECPICKKEWESFVSNIQSNNTKSCCNKSRGWSRSNWEKISNRAILYKVRLYNENESFIKIGITKNNVSKRFRNLPYKYEAIKIIEGASGYIFDLENRTKRLFKKYRYTPLISFKGETECYKK